MERRLGGSDSDHGNKYRRKVKERKAEEDKDR